jgi:hypothetical protein
MNIFKTKSLTWWQVSLLKICVLAFGLAIGANWPELFVGYTTLLVTITIVLSIYLAFVWFKK